MHRGYIKLWRKTLESTVWSNQNVFRFWCWCLLKATYKPITIEINWRIVNLKPGELVFGRLQASKETGLSPQNVRSCLLRLKSTNNITTTSTNRYTIISIINWDNYQVEENETNQQINQLSNQQPTNSQPTANHKQESKEVKNKRKKILSDGNGIPEWIPKDLWADFKEFRIRIKAPLTDRAAKITIKELLKLKDLGNDPVAVLEQSISRGWRGVFPLKGNEAAAKSGPVRYGERN